MQAGGEVPSAPEDEDGEDDKVQRELAQEAVLLVVQPCARPAVHKVREEVAHHGCAPVRLLRLSNLHSSDFVLFGAVGSLVHAACPILALHQRFMACTRLCTGLYAGKSVLHTSGRWKRLTQAHHGIWAVSKNTGSSFVLAMGLSSSIFRRPISASMTCMAALEGPWNQLHSQTTMAGRLQNPEA